MRKDLYKEMFELELNHWWFVGRRKIIKSFLSGVIGNNKLNKMIDIGSGTGGNFSILQKVAKNIYGLESSDEAIYLSKKKYPKIRILKGNLPNINILDKFDGVTLFDVLEHIDNEEETLNAINSILKKNGLIFLTVPAYNFLWTKHDELAHHKRRYTRTHVVNALRKSGFKIIKASYFNTILFIPITVVRFFSKILSKDEGHSDFSKSPAFMNKILHIIFGFEEYLLRFISLPFGVSIICVAYKNNE